LGQFGEIDALDLEEGRQELGEKRQADAISGEMFGSSRFEEGDGNSRMAHDSFRHALASWPSSFVPYSGDKVLRGDADYLLPQKVVKP